MRKGTTQTAEARAKISATLKGRKKSPEHRAALSAAQKGRPDKRSPEGRARQKAAVTAALTGRPRPAEVRAKISLAHLGRKLSPEHRASMRAFNVIKGHHSLADLDPFCRIASCAVCGLVTVRSTGSCAWVCWVAALKDKHNGLPTPTVRYKGQVAAMWKAQGGRCAICGGFIELDKRNGHGACLDHDHDTGFIRKWLCGPCNRGLGYFRDNPAFLRAGALYVETTGIDANIFAGVLSAPQIGRVTLTLQ